MAKRFKTAILALLGVVMALCLAFGAWLWQSAARVNAAEGAQSQNVEHSTVAVHDPSIVLAYEDAEGNTYHEAGEGRTKVYYVFGTQIAQAKSYDLVNWIEFVSNLSDENTLFSVIPESIRNYTGNTTAQALKENCWAPDVIYNRAMGKWCMYLSVNGADYNSVIVLLVADTLDGAWSYMGEVVYSGIRSSNVASTDFEEVTGSNVVDNKYWVKRGSHLSYGVNAIDAAVTYDENGDLWMSYGSWYGGIYLLKLDNFTGLRDGSCTYENATDGTIEDNGTFTVHSDEYLGIHIAGGHQSSGEGSYLLKMGDWWYLFLSYGSYAPEGGYNMRVFRSDNIAGPYTDAAGNSPVCGGTVIAADGSTGVRVMSGYTWSWWDFSYISQGHNSAFVDDDGNAYLVYHNKYTDGTIFHVLKVHQLLVNTDGWLVTSPFESTVQATETSAADEIAVGLSADEIAGTYGYLFMTRSSGTYENVCREQAARLTYTSTEGTLIKGSVTGLSGINPDQTEGTWTYNSETGAFSITPSRDQYVYNGYLLYQNLEGTNIRTLAFTTVSTVAGKCSQYTYWGYRYPAAEQQAQYVVDLLEIPKVVANESEIPTGTHTGTLWDKVLVELTYADGILTASCGEQVVGTYTVSIEGFSNKTETVSVGAWTAPQDFYTLAENSQISLQADISAPTQEYAGIYAILHETGVTDHYYVLRPDCPVVVDSNDTWSYWNEEYFSWNTAQFSKDSYISSGGGTVTWTFTLKDGSLHASVNYVSDTYSYTNEYTFLKNISGVQIGFGTDVVTAGNASVSYPVSSDYMDAVNSAPVINQSWVVGAQAKVYDGTAVRLEATIKGTARWHGVFGDVNMNSDFYRFRVDNYYYTYTGNPPQPAITLASAFDENTYINAINTETGARQVIIIRYFNGALVYQVATYALSDTGYTAPITNCIYSVNVPAKPDFVNVDFYLDHENNIGAEIVEGTQSLLVYPVEKADHIHSYTQTERTGNDCIGYEVKYSCSCGDSYTEMDYTGVTGHDYIARRTESTCVQEGSIVYTCSKCGDSFTVSLPLAEHVWSEDWSKDASQHWHVCTVCGERKDAAAHTWDEGQVTSQATCTGDGVMTYTCTVCGATKTEPIAALGHSWGEWAVTKTPTRTETGMLTRTCTRNGAHTETYELPVLGDTSYTAETVAATCTQAGSITYKLTKDGQEIVVAATELPALGHDYEWTVTTAPTKEETGVLTGVCVVCEDKQEIVLPVLNAEDYEVSIVAATCESAGSETYTYVREGERYTAARIELPALGHDYEWTLGTAPSESAGGTLTGTCTRTDCDSVTTATLPALNDSDYEVTTEDPTCTETGTKTYVYVKDGQEITAATVTLEALGHTWGEAWLHDGTHHWHKCTVCGALSEKEAHGGGEATCVAKAVCEVCGTEYGEVDPDNHRGETYIEGYVAPTEDAEGYTGDTYCSDCGQLLKKGTALPATSHKHATVKVEAVAATCTEAGNIEYWHCSSCGNNYAVENPGSDALPLTNVTLPALGHNYEWSVTKAPTAEAEGEAQGVCSHDPSHIVTETLPVLGDGKYKAETTAATCTQAGETAYIFTLSDGTKIEAATVQLPALSHNYKWTVTTAPTKEETGVLTGVCSVCKDEQETALPVLNAEDYEVTTVAATCESAGSETYTYIKDGQRYMAARIELPALGHSWGEWAVTKAPTRTETGMLTRTCTRNGAHTETYELPVLGDTSYTAETVAATCTQAGSITYKLTKDGQEIVVAATELPALGHDYEWTVTTAPTKEETGVLTGVCVVCEDKQEIVLPVLNAEDYEVSIVAATCESAGSETYTYVREGERYTAARIELPALGHDYEWTLGTAPSESAGGTLTGTCTRTDCDSVTTATLPALNDSDYEVTTEDPTCTETGTKTYVYVKDGQKITAATVTLEALGHDWDEGTVTTPATCTENGVKTFTCTRCDAEKTETIQATGHSAEEIAAVAPTCTQAGSTAGSKCSVCGEILQAPETVAALGHSWSEWTVTKQPTYTEEGEESRTCSVCNEKETRAVAALGLGQKFADEVTAVAQADTRSEKFAAISQALTTYGQLSADEKTEVSEEYAALESAIEAYNTSAQAVNTEAESAVELALRLFSSAIAAMGALAAVWFVVKKFG